MESRIRVHIENRTSSPQVFHITPALWDAALERHPDLAGFVAPSFGVDAVNLDEALKSAHVLVGFRIPTDERIFLASKLRLIQLTGAGLDHLLPLTWLPERIKLATASGAHAGKVGEYVQMALLMLNVGIPHYAASARARRWQPQFSTSIVGKTVLFVGVGQMGGAGAARAKALGLRTLGIRPSQALHPSLDEVFAPEDIDDVVGRADFVVLAAPLTSRSRGIMGQQQITRMKRGAGLVNIGRAGLLDYHALGEALQAGMLSGAVLDVFEPEPLPADSFVWNLPNAILTPHVSSDDQQEYVPRVLDILFQNLRRLKDDKPLINVVDRAREY